MRRCRTYWECAKTLAHTLFEERRADKDSSILPDGRQGQSHLLLKYLQLANLTVASAAPAGPSHKESSLGRPLKLCCSTLPESLTPEVGGRYSFAHLKAVSLQTRLVTLTHPDCALYLVEWAHGSL